MTAATQYLQKKLLDHTLGLAAYTMPTAAYMGLFKSSPGEEGLLTAEVSGGSYARVEITSKMSATVLATGRSTNTALILFANPTASWGTVTHYGVCDAASAGNVLFQGPLDASLVVNTGHPPPQFVVGGFYLEAPSDASPFATQYLAKKLLDHTLGLAAYTMPTNSYLALFSADPGAAGSLVSEIATGGYARQVLTSAIDATVLATGIATSKTAIQFPTPSAGYLVTHYGVTDAASAGNLLLRKARGGTQVITSGGSPVRIDAGHLALAIA